ncbi:MAG: hypothetical protein RLZZ342_534 [Candidatus Parcubacteria bacterium]
MAEKSGSELVREAYRTEYAVVGSVWQSLQRERFFLAGIFVTTIGVLFGVFSASTRLLVVTEKHWTSDAFLRAIPIVVFLLTVFVWLSDRALQRAQQVTRSRGAELERLLGLERGLFTQMYHWRMFRVGVVELREMLALIILLGCVVTYVWMWSYATTSPNVPTPATIFTGKETIR